MPFPQSNKKAPYGYTIAGIDIEGFRFSVSS
jgi:hypothetical protein